MKLHGSIRAGEAILECDGCGKRSFVTVGAPKHACPFCDKVLVVRTERDAVKTAVSAPVATKVAPARRPMKKAARR